MISQLFGVPYYSTKIDPLLYNKSEIISSILENYSQDPLRNVWDNNDTVLTSKLHQGVNYFTNKNYIKINFNPLISIVQDKILNFFDHLNFSKKFGYKFRIVNYTCMDQGNFLKDHNHKCDFSGILYLKFNKDIHKPTAFVNGNNFSQYLNYFSPASSLLDTSDIDNSWVSPYFSVPVNEDDFVIVPGCLNHFVPPFDGTNDLRMTIVFNIDLTEEVS